PLFHSINRNKLGILLDLTHSESIELIKRLVRISDGDKNFQNMG
ncbi:CoA transferase, partial [bacterium]|nr:CoA transferase [bacterium]